ncbi:hypothetical protein N9485_02405 [Luminiphilus sp.]|nr:hypothetical protein [Luminiphilus sp.]MDA8986162.1 hypothetical protein [Luminiphilus sp.]MDB2644347.1 hypothetical protein [Luminiphilus sp.]MDB4049041.1 hypothetical protein [Luminiphilus sp.]MDC1116305.1 hypothetical protein [Luminiphilus sp.]
MSIFAVIGMIGCILGAVTNIFLFTSGESKSAHEMSATLNGVAISLIGFCHFGMNL